MRNLSDIVQESYEVVKAHWTATTTDQTARVPFCPRLLNKIWDKCLSIRIMGRP